MNAPDPNAHEIRARGMSRPFLTARWEDLLFLNYECPADLLAPLVPRGTTLDPWRGRPLVSLVGFMFRDTRVRSVPVPGHRTFEEVNLRFYVLRETSTGEQRRAVVFVRELVPRRLIALVARTLYNEPYLAVPMWHRVGTDPERGGTAEYGWSYAGNQFHLRGRASGAAADSEAGSEAEFITEHYWGYTRQRDGGTLEYRVDHPRWRLWELEEASFTGRAETLYGDGFGDVLAGEPRSAYLAVGSDVSVHPGRRLHDR